MSSYKLPPMGPTSQAGSTRPNSTMGLNPLAPSAPSAPSALLAPSSPYPSNYTIVSGGTASSIGGSPSIPGPSHASNVYGQQTTQHGSNSYKLPTTTMHGPPATVTVVQTSPRVQTSTVSPPYASPSTVYQQSPMPVSASPYSQGVRSSPLASGFVAPEIRSIQHFSPPVDSMKLAAQAPSEEDSEGEGESTPPLTPTLAGYSTGPGAGKQDPFSPLGNPEAFGTAAAAAATLLMPQITVNGPSTLSGGPGVVSDSGTTNSTGSGSIGSSTLLTGSHAKTTDSHYQQLAVDSNTQKLLTSSFADMVASECKKSGSPPRASNKEVVADTGADMYGPVTQAVVSSEALPSASAILQSMSPKSSQVLEAALARERDLRLEAVRRAQEEAASREESRLREQQLLAELEVLRQKSNKSVGESRAEKEIEELRANEERNKMEDERKQESFIKQIQDLEAKLEIAERRKNVTVEQMVNQSMQQHKSKGQANSIEELREMFSFEFEQFKLQQEKELLQMKEQLHIRQLINSADKFIAIDQHPYKSLIVKVLGADNLTIPKALTGSNAISCVAALGAHTLESRGESRPTETMTKKPQSGYSVSCGDSYHFPFVNERYLTLSMHVMSGSGSGSGSQSGISGGTSAARVSSSNTNGIDLGSCEIDLESFVTHPEMNSPAVQTAMLRDRTGKQCGAVVYSVAMLTDLVTSSFVARRPKEIVNPLESAISMSLANGMETGSYSNVMKEPSVLASTRNLIKRTTSIDDIVSAIQNLDTQVSSLHHQYKTLRIVATKIVDLNLNKEKSAPFLRVKTKSFTMVTENPPLVDKSTAMSKGVVFNAEFFLPYQDDRNVRFHLFDEASPEVQCLGRAYLDVEQLLMTGSIWHRRDVTIKDYDEHPIGELHLVLEFMTSAIPKPFSRAIKQEHILTVASARMPKGGSMPDPKYVEKTERKIIKKDSALRSMETNMMLQPISSLEIIVMGFRDLQVSSKASSFVKTKIGNFEVETPVAHHSGQSHRWRLQETCYSFDYEKQRKVHELICFEVWQMGKSTRDSLVGLAVLEVDKIKTLPGRMFSGELRIQDKNGEFGGYLAATVHLR